MDPATHAYPALQFPLHSAVVRLGRAPYFPAGHRLVQLALGRPEVAPYRPAAQSVQLAAPVTLYFPGVQMAAVADADPAAHA